MRHRGDLVVGTFDEVVGGELAAITRRLNSRFGTTFAEFEPTVENVERCLREIDETGALDAATATASNA